MSVVSEGIKIIVSDNSLDDWLSNLKAAPDLDSRAKRLGELLGLPGPAPIASTERVLNDTLFARAVFTARKMPEVLNWLLTAQADAYIADVPPAEERPKMQAQKAPSSLELAGKVGRSLLKWGMAGLEHAKPWEIERRLAACQKCIYQEDAPDTLIYRSVSVAVAKDAKICSVCHCLTNTKAALATERCPERDPDRPDLSRWGEPWEEPAEPNGIWR